MLHHGVLGPWSVLIFQSRSLWTSERYSSPRKDVGSLVISEDLGLRRLTLFPFGPSRKELAQPRAGFELLDHVLGHGGEVVLRLPSPLLSRKAVVDGLRPGVGYLLPEVGHELARKVRDVLLDLLREHPGGEVHSCEVVAHVVGDLP